MFEILSFSFMQNAIFGAILVSVACGIIGSLVMINRLFSLAGGITHGAFGGIGLGFYLGLSGVAMFASTAIFGLFLAIIVAYLSKAYPHRSDNIIAVIWAFGMAFGIILVDKSSDFGGDLMSYLFGNILAISGEDLAIMGVCDVLFVGIAVVFYRQFESMSFDSEFAGLKGVKTGILYVVLVCAIALCVVVAMRVVGLILVLALLGIPCFIAERFARTLGGIMLLSCIFSAIFCLIGLALSYALNLSSGASIILVACASFVLVGLNIMGSFVRNV